MLLRTHTEAETFDRKELVKALASHLGVRPVYNGMPTRSYTVGSYTVDWDGNLIGDDFTPISAFLIAQGYAQPSDFEALNSEAQSDGASTDEASTAEASAAPALDSEAPAGIRFEKRNITTDSGDFLAIGMPVPDMTILALKNLVFMLYTKQRLLNKAFGADVLLIHEKLVDRLQEYTPESLEEFHTILNDAWSLDMLVGFMYEDGKVTMAFPFEEAVPDNWKLYAELMRLVVMCALRSKRTKPVLQEPENERYFMHSWLIRLGCGGPAHKALRRRMLEKLGGYCAFPDETRAQRHRDRYKEIRRIRREVNEEADKR